MQVAVTAHSARHNLVLPPRSTAGQLTLDQHIGVRIPGGQPNYSTTRSFASSGHSDLCPKTCPEICLALIASRPTFSSGRWYVIAVFTSEWTIVCASSLHIMGYK